MDRNQEEVVMSQTAHDAIVSQLNTEHAAALAAAVEKAKAEGVAEGGKARDARFAAILADEKIKGREALAFDLALKSPDMKAEDVVAFIAKMPTASTIPSIAQRQSGVDLTLATAPTGGPPDAKQVWAKITERSNRARGFPAH